VPANTKLNKVFLLLMTAAATLVFMIGLFTPQADAAGEVIVELPYEHIWNNYSDDPTVDDSFTYIIKGTTPDTVMPLGSEDGAYYFNLKGNVNGALYLTFPYTTVGEYDYTVSAYVPDPKEGYTYEPRVFTLKIYVSETDGVLSVYALTIQDQLLSKYDVIPLDPYFIKGMRIEIPYSQEFHNNTGDATVDSTFWYILTPVTEDAPMPEGSVDGQYIFSVTSDIEDFLYLFIDFTEEGTYVYQFTSYVPNPQDGYTYDTSVYYIEIVVGKTVDSLVIESVLIKDSTGRILREIPLNPSYDAGTPSSPDSPNSPSRPDTPKTGDETHMNLYMIIMGVSAAAVIGIAIFLIVRKLRKDDEDE